MKDKPLPNFNFTDLNGHIYNKESCTGKIVVLNFWFINCAPCVAEIPQLNQLVGLYKNRDDIIFLGLTWDAPSDLKTFLEKYAFKYAIIPEMQQYLKETLTIPGYPSHAIINKEGIVVNMPEDFKELEIALKNESL